VGTVSSGTTFLKDSMDVQRKVVAEVLGTLWLVLGGCGSAVLAGVFLTDGVDTGIGFLGVSLAFGLTVVTGAYALGHISGGHFNPAVTVGVLAARRIEPREAAIYIVAQVVGAVIGAAHPHPPHQHPRHQHLGEPGPLDRPGGVRRGLGARAALAVLGGTDRRGGAGRRRPPLRHRGAARDGRRPRLTGGRRGARLGRVAGPPPAW
jgi:hypothetical protein